MARRIIVLATDGDSREDGNVYYSNYVIVESATLKFDEDIFADDAAAVKQADFLAAVRALGYTVDEPEIVYVLVED